MKTRILSALIGVPLILVVLLCHSFFPLCINILCAVASLLCCIELLNAKKIAKDLNIALPCMLFSALTPTSVNIRMFISLTVLFMIYLFILLIVQNKRYTFTDISYIFTAIGLNAVGFSCVVLSSIADETKSCFYITLCLVIPWVADAGAYFVGSFMGKTKLCPDISPKKTVEGAVGGIITGVIGAIIDALVFKFIIFQNSADVHFVAVGILAVIGTVLSIIGDLTFSLIKRSCNVKDYGNVIPGHGGFLDRCDSIIMTAPFIYVFTMFFPLVSLT